MINYELDTIRRQIIYRDDDHNVYLYNGGLIATPQPLVVDGEEHQALYGVSSRQLPVMLNIIINWIHDGNGDIHRAYISSMIPDILIIRFTYMEYLCILYYYQSTDRFIMKIDKNNHIFNGLNFKHLQEMIKEVLT